MKRDDLTRMSFTVPIGLREEIEKYADWDRIPVGAWIQRACIEAMNWRDTRIQATTQAAFDLAYQDAKEQLGSAVPARS